MRAGIFMLMLALMAGPAWAGGGSVSLLVMDGETVSVSKAIEGLKKPGGVKVRYFTSADLEQDTAAADFVKTSRIILVDVMAEELYRFVLEHVDTINTSVFALRTSRVDDELKTRGFRFDPAVRAYFDSLSVANLPNMVLRAVHDVLDQSVEYREPVLLPECGVYHPAGESSWREPEAYIRWYEKSGRAQPAEPWIGVTFYASSMVPGQKEALDEVISGLERAGFNVLACFGRDEKILSSILLDGDDRRRVDLVLAFSLKFRSALNEKLRSTLGALDVPVINGINLFSSTLEEWSNDPAGIPPMEVAWTLAKPEISGLVEPTTLGGKVPQEGASHGTVFVRRTIQENLDLLLPRLRQWVRLAQMPAREKRIAVLYYNHSQGKQNIGASYLNVFQSLETIIARLRVEGISIEGEEGLSREGLQASILRAGRNVGSWAPGELDRMTRAGEVVRVPFSEYKAWFEALPRAFRERVLDQWGPPEYSRIMVRDRAFIVPALVLGNVVLMPEPARGWGDDPMKLYHDPSLQPHHQYIAAYLWLKKGFGADAVIHLGTHATHEWLPGKQAGLSHACPPEVLLGDLPNIYPYIVDDVGEAIQAKRRGRGVIIGHLTPPLVKGGLYGEYSEIYDAIQRFNMAVSMDSRTSGNHLYRIQELALKTGILSDLALPHGTGPRWDASGRVEGVEVIPGRLLNRPRIDVLVNPSGLYRDLFPNLMILIDEAVELASAETDLENFIRRNTENIRNRLVREGMDAEKAEALSRVRIFSERPGTYGNAVSEMVSNSGLWESDVEIARVYERRTGYAFGGGMWGKEAPEVFHEHLRDVDTAVHSISSAVYGTMDNDDVFQFLEGLSLAIRNAGGEAPKTVISMNRERDEIQVEGLARVLGRESRTRYFNPKWISSMKEEGYAGAREMAHFAEYLWGWQVTTPGEVPRSIWDQTYEVYVEDKYELDLDSFFSGENPWAHQSMTARMLESVRKGYWDPEEAVRKRLAGAYAVSVVEKGVACCDHTCNNPYLNQMVVNILSLPGVISPEAAAAFRAAVEQSAGKSLEDEVQARRDLQRDLVQGFSHAREQAGEKRSDASSTPQEESPGSGVAEHVVEGYLMETMDLEPSIERPPSSGAPWWASLMVLFWVALFGLGASRPGRKRGI